jgi:hypothetical protein
MSHINYIANLTKLVGHHIKVQGKDDYEPCMFIVNETSPRFKGKAFVIALSAMFKYCNPFLLYSEPKLIEEDKRKFYEAKEKAMEHKQRLDRGLIVWSVKAMQQANRDLAAFAVAEMLHQSDGFMLRTGYNLACCLQMFDITPCPAAAAQLLMFIEDSIDDLKNTPPVPEERKLVGGGAVIWNHGQKIFSGDLLVKESDVIEETCEVDGPDLN